MTARLVRLLLAVLVLASLAPLGPPAAATQTACDGRPDTAIPAMAAFLVRALGLTDDGGGNLFVDDAGSVFEGAIDRLAAAGITMGCNPPVNDRFCPNDHVTRGEMAAFLKRATG